MPCCGGLGGTGETGWEWGSWFMRFLLMLGTFQLGQLR